MKKLPQEQPVDDLFARKLANMSLPTSPNGFARLQARMGQSEPETRVVFWRNPTVQRYIAVAACLLLVCMVGWLYLLSETPIPGKEAIAINKLAVSAEQKHSRKELTPAPETEVALIQPAPEQRIPLPTDLERTTRLSEKHNRQIVGERKNDVRQLARANQAKPGSKTAVPNGPTVVSVPMERVAEAETKVPSVEPTIGKQPAVSIDKLGFVAERVLVVTIAEPEAVSVARRTVTPTEEKVVVSVVDKPGEEAKGINLWQRVKRIKQGEVFARKDADEAEQGLLSRAYSGLKQTFDKDKSAKQ